MIDIGTKVTCIDDNFPAWARATYTDLPVKGNIYTIRHIDRGVDCQELVKNGSSEDFSGQDPRKFKGVQTIMILLAEIINPPHLDSKKEPGFKLERFAPLIEPPAQKVSQKESKPRPKKVSKPKKKDEKLVEI
jgi:hypothetical protein